MMKHVVIIGGGSPADWPDLSDYVTETTAWIGVDRGTLYGLEAGFPIMSAVGDFDSMTEEEYSRLLDKVPDVSRCQAEKDDTDTHLGLLKAHELYPEAEYILIGMTGGRLDHFLTNLWMPLEPRFTPLMSQIKLLDDQNSIHYFEPGSYVIEKELDKKYLAFVCLTGVEKLTLSDVKYQLTERDFMHPVSLSSNEFLDKPGKFSFSSGIMCVIQSRDKRK